MKLSDQTRKYDELIELAYSSADDAEPWFRFVDLLKDLLGARDATVILRREARPNDFDDEVAYLLTTSDRMPHLTAEYLDAAMRASEQILNIQHPRPEQLHESVLSDVFLSTPLHAQFQAPIDIKYLMMMDIHRTDTMCMKLAAEKTAQQGAFTSYDKELIQTIAPHLKRAMLYQSEKQGGLKLKHFYEHILNKLELGCILLDEQGSLISENQAAERALKSGTGIEIRGGQLIASDSIANPQELRKAIGLAANAARNKITSQPGKVIGLRSKAGELVLEVVVKPYIVDMLSSAGRIPAVSVVISESAFDEALVDFQDISSMYGFTPQEAKVAAYFGKGLNVNDIAAEMDVSVNTTRTHLRGIYAKTGFNRQTQLVALVTRSLARLS